MKIALAQINPTVGDFHGNSRKIIQFAQEAAAARADLVMFSELAVCGYPPADLLEKPSFVTRAGEAIGSLGLPTAIVQEGGYNIDVIGMLLQRFMQGFGE